MSITTTVSSIKHFDIAITDQGEASATFVGPDGEFVTVPSSHPNFERVADALRKGEDPFPFLTVTDALRSFAAIDARVTFEADGLYFAGELVNSKLADTILRYRAEGRDTNGLVRFLERLQLNPNENSRNELWGWVERTGLHVDKDGCFLAFKGVNDRHADDDFPYQSASTGTAWVDGVKYEGRIPNRVGAVVTMPRKDVDENTRLACSNGLHVGTFQYASTFATHLMEVRIGPEDVVSVPRDHAVKLRCQRYEVLAVQEKKANNLSHHEPAATWSSDDLADALVSEDVPRSFLDKLLGRNKVIQTTED